MYITPVIFKKRSFLTVVHSMKGEELAPVEHIVQTLQEKTRRVVELSARGIGAIQVYIVLFIVI